MPDSKVKFEMVCTGIIGINALNAAQNWSRIAELGVSVLCGSKEVDWKWQEPAGSHDAKIELKASSDGLELELTVSGAGDPVKVDLTLHSRKNLELNACRINLDFMPGAGTDPASQNLDYCHVQHLVPKPGMVIADAVFRSPAIAVRKQGMALALLPDLACMAKERRSPWALDFDRIGPKGAARLSLAVLNYRVVKHVYFVGDAQKTIEVPESGLKLSAHLLACADEGADFPRHVQQFLWTRYGSANYAAVKPQVLGLDELGQEAMSRLFKRDDLYFEFEHQGAKRAGLAAFAATTAKPQKPVPPWSTAFMSLFNAVGLNFVLVAGNVIGISPWTDDLIRNQVHGGGIKLIPQAWFTSWFNNLRTAYGARWLAEKWGDKMIMERADRIKALALSAPVEDGIFHSICFFPKGRVWWKRGTITFSPIQDFHTPDQATTGYMMLRWFKDIDPDPALLDMARGLGKFFKKHQLASGAVPAWIKGKTLEPINRLLESASTAGPMMFMAMLAAADKDESAAASAGRMADFILREVIPEQKWFDYETFYSCTRQPRKCRDQRSGMYPANSMSMCWAAEGARILYELTGEPRFLELLQRSLDALLWRQQVWDNPTRSINTFGGFNSMNTDAEWNDARQGMIAPVLMDCYRVFGEPEYFERGVGALRSCYTTMLHPALREVAPGNMVHYRETDRGAVYENYAHTGYDRVIAGYQMPDWGAGTAAFATAHSLKFYGDVFVDLKFGHAFGVNGCVVKSFERQGALMKLQTETLVPGLPELTVKVRGASDNTRLLLNGKDHAFEKVG